MAGSIAIVNLQKTIGQRILFEDVSFNLNSGERYGLVGANGAGKSTFLKVLLGQDQASGGEVRIPRELSIGWLNQDQFMHDDWLIIDTVMQGDKAVYEAMKEKEAHLNDPNFDAHHLAELEDLILRREGYTLSSRSAEVLEGLGIPANVHDKPLSVLSGGFKLRVLLAQLLISSPDVLLLDEPTNHLDIVTIRWLEKFLINFEGCALVISHDRRFLDQVCTQMLDVDYETITPYAGNYTAFEKSKQLIKEQKEAELAGIKEQIAHKQSFVDRFGAKASKARQAQSRLKQIEKIEIPEIKPSSRRHPYFQFVSIRPSGKEVLKVEHLGKSYGAKKVLDNVSVEVRRGDRIGIIGPNGIGKSTFLKVLISEVAPDTGKFTWGHEAKIGYFAQNHDVLLKKERGTPEEWLWQFCRAEGTQYVWGMLGRVLFSGSDAKKDIQRLSGGELARLDLARLMVEKPNVLFLDEPTNHLDVEAIEALVKALKTYDGTLIFVSHDRWFVSELATRILELTPGGVQDFKGTFNEYLSSCGDDHLDAQALIKKKKAEARLADKDQDAKTQFEDSKQRRAEKRKIETEIERITQSMTQIESRQKEIESKFCEPGFFEKASTAYLKSLAEEQDVLKKNLQEQTKTWENLESRLVLLTSDGAEGKK